MIHKKHLRTVIIISMILILIPILVFAIKFYSQSFSNNISDWASFGNYISGIISPIISLLSLIVLGYITFLMTKISTEENKNLFIYQKRIDAYEQLLKFIPETNTNPERLAQIIREITREINMGLYERLSIFDPKSQELFEHVSFYSNYHYFIYNFNSRYGHLFEYDFACNDYENLKEITFEMKEIFNNFYEKISEGILSDRKLEIEKLGVLFDKQKEYIVKFINGLREEL